ncbi:MAG: OAM dimerization domain-containing protein [Bacillota bacterium]|jgi:beta-lysine 5,6-aminomutase beta subunit
METVMGNGNGQATSGGRAANAPHSDLVLPYGDQRNDGVVQVSFTLPVAAGPLAEEAARQTMKLMGLEDPQVAEATAIGEEFTFFVGYGKLTRAVELSKLRVAAPMWEELDQAAVNQLVQDTLGRPMVVVGAATGSDAHTVGLDAILNYKGFAGNRGLEAYSAFKVVNMGSQVPNEELVAKARELGADAILVSQVVTERNVHLANLTNLVELLEAEGLRDQVVLVVGGPRITHALAIELGYDAGFGPSTRPQDVASYLAQEVSRRMLN